MDDNEFEDDWSDDHWSDDDSDTETQPCPACGADVYEEADQCPMCGEYIIDSGVSLAGRPLWFAILGLLGVIAVIVACLGLM